MKKLKYDPGNFKLLVKRSTAGLGLFAGEDMPKGVCVIEYFGRTISSQEKYTSKSRYLFGVNSRCTIDGSARKHKARYINHSCRPNAEAIMKNNRIFIMARRQIKTGEEITYDYGKEYWNEHIKPRGCRCPKCQEKLKK